jgi:hypothetical protein
MRDHITLPTRRLSRTSFLTRAILVLATLVMFAGLVVFETWPERPRDLIGLALALLVGVPLLFFGEFVGEAVSKRAPLDPGRWVSARRIAWVLGVVLLSVCVLMGVLYGQRRYLGDPLGALGRLVAPHYHRVDFVMASGLNSRSGRGCSAKRAA